MDKFELQMRYKAETGLKAWHCTYSAHITKYGETIIEEELPDELNKEIKKKGFIELPDMDYLNWLEDKVMNLL